MKNYKIRIHGASDDLVEIDGDLSEEFGSFDRASYLRFTNGVYLKIEYTRTGIWHVDILDPGHAQLVQKIGEGVPDEMVAGNTPSKKEHELEDVCSYSDCVEVRDLLPIELYRISDRPVPAPTTAHLIAARAIKTLVAKEYIDVDDTRTHDDVLEILATAIAANLSTETNAKGSATQ